MVKVKPTASQGRITVRSNNDTTIFGIKDNLSEYYAKLSERWANSPDMVNGIDYSSKYYAEKSKESANKAEIYKNNTLEAIDGFEENMQVAKDDIEQNRINSINAINNTCSIVMGDMQEKSDEVLTLIESSKAEAVDSINTTKTTILQDIEFVADGEKEEIEDLIDSGKEELKEAIRDVKVLTTLEIGDIGFTQMVIDESKGLRRILNGQLIIQDQYVQFTNIIKESVALNPSLACTESEWQTAVTMSTNGVCEKFVIDDEAGTIRLPKYPTYIDLTNNASAKTQTVSIKGNGKSLGFMNGSNNFGLIIGGGNEYYRVLFESSADAYGKNIGTASTPAQVDAGKAVGLTTDSTKSGITGSVTVPAVTSEKIKGTYFIQVATGAETEDNIINEIELNNPFSLLDYKYSEYELNNLSWLRSQGQYNSKAVYPAVYDLLLKIYNGAETKAGVSVKLTTETFTDYDFVLNTAEETFRLPIKVKLASGKAVVGNGMTLGLTNGKGDYGLIGYTQNSVNIASVESYGQEIGNGALGTYPATTTNGMGVTTDPTKSGIETSDRGLYLYFYVGETVQNANLINAGRIEEKVASLIPDNSSLISGYAMPSSKYIDLTLGASGSNYTAPANGYFYIRKKSSGANQYVWMQNASAGNLAGALTFSKASGDYLSAFVPAKKGQKIAVEYNVGGATQFFRFIYAEGDR